MKRHTNRPAARRLFVAVAITSALTALSGPSPAESGAWFTGKTTTTGTMSAATFGAPTNFTASAQSDGNTLLSWDAATTQKWATTNSVTSGVNYTVTRTFDDSTTTVYSGQSAQYTDPIFTPQPETYVQVAAGQQHTLARAKDGTVWAWGSNTQGEYGDGSTTTSYKPVQTPLPLRAAVQVEAGNMFSVALLDDGNVWAWGSNTYGQLGDGTKTSRTRAVQVKFPQGISIKALGDLNGITGSVYAIDSNDYLWAWGANNWGQLGDGTVVDRTTPVQIPNFRVKSIAAGRVHALAVGIDNALWAWGNNDRGQIGDGTTNSRTRPVRVPLPGGLSVNQVAAGAEFSMVLDSNGDVRTWGSNNYGQLGLGFRSPDDTISPAKPVMPNTAIARIVTGRNSACILAVEKSIYCWGYNSSAVLGDGSTTDRYSATENQVLKGDNVVDLSLSDANAFGLVQNGTDTTLLAWGWGDSGQLGNGLAYTGEKPNTFTVEVYEARRCIPGTNQSGSKCIPKYPVTYSLKYNYLAWASPVATAER